MASRHGYGPSRLPMQELRGNPRYAANEEYENHIERVKGTAHRMFTLANMGRDNAPLVVWMSSSEGVLLTRGCFLGSLWDFEQAVRASYGTDYKDGVSTSLGPDGRRYMAVIDMLYAINDYQGQYTPRERCCDDCDSSLERQKALEVQAVGD